jgi:acyl carrier protein
MDRRDVQAELEALFRRVLRAPDLVLTRDMVTGSHPHWDSFANVEILLGCEERWNFEFDTTEIDAIRSFGDLNDAILARIG